MDRHTLELATEENGTGWQAEYSAKVEVKGSGSASSVRRGITIEHLNAIDTKESNA